MKLTKTATLVFAEGRSEKVYAVDLCEVGTNQYVVNFRYGKRGAPLKDGSKTAMPVGKAEAERIYDKVIEQQLEKGYLPEGTARPAAASPTAIASPPMAVAPPRVVSRSAASDKQKAAILDRLAAPPNDRRWFKRPGGKTWNLDRAIWRAGELRLGEAEPLLLKLLGSAAASTDVNAGGRGIRDYSIAAALGRLGGPASMQALTRLYGDAAAPPHVQRIATLALLNLSDEPTRAEFADHMAQRLPAELQTVARAADAGAFQMALRAYLSSHGAEAWGVVDIAYVIDSPTVRPAVLAELETVPLTPPYFFFVRHIFKAAEYKRDALVFGILARRFEKTRENFSGSRYMASREPTAYGGSTRRYLRDRVWRTLRRAGLLSDRDYVKMAVGVLLAFNDQDAVTPTPGYGAWAPYLAFNHILYENSPRFELASDRKRFRIKGNRSRPAPVAALREEAFPKLWEERPEGLMHLLAASACGPVHEFAAEAIRAVPAFLDRLEIDDLVMLLSKPYETTVKLGLELAEKRYDKNAPDLTLLEALAQSAYALARGKGHQWIDEQRTRVLSETSFMARLVIGKYQDTRLVLRRIIKSSVLSPEINGALALRIIAEMLALSNDPAEDARARDATLTVLSALSSQSLSIDATVIKDLLAHPLAGVQELGAELLLRSAAKSGEAISDAVMVQILHSAHENVRAVGLRLLGELPLSTLTKMELLLVRLTTDKNADLRNASRSIVARVAASNAGAGETIARALVEALLRRKLPAEAPSHVLTVLKEDMMVFLSSLSSDEVWRLLQSSSPHAQELGGILLQNVDPAKLEIDQIVSLASHEILSIRAASWAFYEKSEARVRRQMAEASRILDAKWDDSRAFAFGYFRDRLGPDAFDADVLVTILDSVRDDVQAFGRELAQKYFRDEDGPTLMTKLSEHPSMSVQLFTTNYLTRFASNDETRIAKMVPYFESVLARVSQGRFAKQRVLAFLETEGARNAESARQAVTILHRLSATISIEYRGAAIAAMVGIHHAQPSVELPIRIKEPPLRGADGIPVRI